MAGGFGNLSGIVVARLSELLDEFKSHANNCNHVRSHYAYILAELSESKILDSIFTQIYGMEVKYQKLSENLGEAIRKSAYALS